MQIPRFAFALMILDDYGTLEIKGHFEAKLPESVRMGRYPEDGVFRISPRLFWFGKTRCS